MGRVFEYRTTVRSDWIDYNGHMQDAFYGLVFSYGVDQLQDAVGFDADYRARTGCTIYLLEDHKFFLREVKKGDALVVRTYVLGVTDKRFHLWSEMLSGDTRVAVAEMMELHVRQHPAPKGAAIPDDIRARLDEAVTGADGLAALSPRARQIGL